jgi:nucleoside-diphosphate-sugar epimerase
MKTTAIVGASGFVGATLVERMVARGDQRIRPLIHSPGNAWRLARNESLELDTVDLLSEPDVRRALAGCTHVVNCSRGNPQVMGKGLENLLKVSKDSGVERFVHLSSVAVYGDPPPAASEREDAPTEPEKNSYGWVKLQQDLMVQRATRNGLPSVILCPPNISGAYSAYLVSLVNSIRAGRLALVDGGSLPCNLVDVENLSHAIERALVCERATAERLFVTDGGPTTWRDVATALAPLAEREEPLPSISLDEANRRYRASGAATGSVKRTLKHLVSSEVNVALRQDPYLKQIDDLIRWPVKVMGKDTKKKIKRWIKGPQRVAKIGDDAAIDPTLVATQLRGVRHSCDRARAAIGYDPPHSFEESVAIFRRWYTVTHGFDLESWSMARDLLTA